MNVTRYSNFRVLRSCCTKRVYSKQTIIDEETQRKRLNSAAVKKFNWENRTMYGPLLKSIDVASRDRKLVTYDKKAVSNLKWETTYVAKKKGVPKINFIDLTWRNKLGNQEWTTEGITQLLARTIDSENVLKGLSKQTLPENTLFPFIYDSKNSSSIDFDNKLQRQAAKIVHLDDGSHLHQPFEPSVSNVLIQTTSAENKSNSKLGKLKFVTQFGLDAFYNHLRELQRIENSLRKCLEIEFTDNAQHQQVRLNAIEVGFWNSLVPFYATVSNVTLDIKIKHSKLFYCGVIDCIGQWQNRKVIIEIILPYEFLPLMNNFYDSPLRAAAYMGAINAEEDKINQVDEILLIYPNPDGSPATVHVMDMNLCEIAWNAWIERLQTYWHYRTNNPDCVQINLSSK